MSVKQISRKFKMSIALLILLEILKAEPVKAMTLSLIHISEPTRPY